MTSRKTCKSINLIIIIIINNILTALMFLIYVQNITFFLRSMSVNASWKSFMCVDRYCEVHLTEMGFCSFPELSPVVVMHYDNYKTLNLVKTWLSYKFYWKILGVNMKILRITDRKYFRVSFIFIIFQEKRKVRRRRSS